ncbi:MAG TPA: multicopper oxidase domain-containing protein, partial [Capillimicrobium sp.]
MDRRGFLGVGGAALICTIGGKTVEVRTPEDLEQVDAAMRKLQRPKGGKRAPEPVDTLRFGTPEPQPGGQVREYWIEARSLKWDVAPTGRDDWMDHPVPKPRTFRAFAYRLWSEGFARPIGPPTIPGPTLHAEVGDILRVHFRNGDEAFGQAVTMHPHGVRYTPDYDGAYLGERTRVGGFVAPGEEFTYTWEATPDSVGAWPYHDHGPNHAINSRRGLFGALIVREKGAAPADVEVPLFLHAFSPAITKLRANLQCVNGRVFAGNTPTVRARVGQSVAFYVFGGDDMLHTFHIHGHRWRRPDGVFTDNELLGPETVLTARWTEDNPGRWLYHCHVL